jgi:hypothetical protein
VRPREVEPLVWFTNCRKHRNNAQNPSMSEMAWFRHLGTHALIFDSRRRIGPNLSLALGTPITQQDSIPTLLSPAADFMNARAPEVTSN